jgi:hypothetical protein
MGRHVVGDSLAGRHAAGMIWVTHMKTTVDIADALLVRAKRLAARRGTTLKVVLEEALRDALARGGDEPPAPPLRTHSVHGQGLQPGLSWDDFSAIRDLAYEGRGG